MKSGLYKITIGDYYYFGSASKITSRKSAHKRSLEDGKHVNKFLQRAWNKYKEINFEVLLYCTIDQALIEEQRLIDIHHGDGKCMNLSTNAKNAFACPENREKTSERNRNRIWTQEAREKISSKNRGRKHKEGIFEQRSKAYLGHNNPNAKLTEYDRIALLQGRKSGESIKSLAEKFMVNESTVSRLCSANGVFHKPKQWSDKMRISQQKATERNPNRYSRDVKGEKNPRHISKNASFNR